MLGKRKSNPTGVTWGFFYVPRITEDRGVFTTDKKGYIFSEFFKMLASEKETELPSSVLEHPDRAFNYYIRNYSMVAVIRDHEGNVVCYSVDYRNRLPAGFTDQLRSYLNLMPDDTVLWTDDVFKDPQEASAREVIYGQKPQKPPAEKGPATKRSAQMTPTQRAKAAKQWQHPGELSQSDMDYLTGKSKEPPKP